SRLVEARRVCLLPDWEHPWFGESSLGGVVLLTVLGLCFFVGWCGVELVRFRDDAAVAVAVVLAVMAAIGFILGAYVWVVKRVQKEVDAKNAVRVRERAEAKRAFLDVARSIEALVPDAKPVDDADPNLLSLPTLQRLLGHAHHV